MRNVFEGSKCMFTYWSLFHSSRNSISCNKIFITSVQVARKQSCTLPNNINNYLKDSPLQYQPGDLWTFGNKSLQTIPCFISYETVSKSRQFFPPFFFRACLPLSLYIFVFHDDDSDDYDAKQKTCTLSIRRFACLFEIQ